MFKSLEFLSNDSEFKQNFLHIETICKIEHNNSQRSKSLYVDVEMLLIIFRNIPKSFYD